jgi:hypothetical protein
MIQRQTMHIDFMEDAHLKELIKLIVDIIDVDVKNKIGG